jgi:hypothetical protein
MMTCRRLKDHAGELSSLESLEDFVKSLFEEIAGNYTIEESVKDSLEDVGLYPIVKILGEELSDNEEGLYIEVFKGNEELVYSTKKGRFTHPKSRAGMTRSEYLKMLKMSFWSGETIVYTSSDGTKTNYHIDHTEEPLWEYGVWRFSVL